MFWIFFWQVLHSVCNRRCTRCHGSLRGIHGIESVSKSALPLVWLWMLLLFCDKSGEQWLVWSDMQLRLFTFCNQPTPYALLRTPRSWVRASFCMASTNSKTMASWITINSSWVKVLKVEFASSNSLTVPVSSLFSWQIHTWMVVLRSIVAVFFGGVLCRKTSRYSHHRSSKCCFYHGWHTYVVAKMLPKRYFILLSCFIIFSKKVSTTRWFKVPFSSPSWRSLNRLKGSLNHPKKVTLNHQAHVCQTLPSRGWCFTGTGGSCCVQRGSIYGAALVTWQVDKLQQFFT